MLNYQPHLCQNNLSLKVNHPNLQTNPADVSDILHSSEKASRTISRALKLLTANVFVDLPTACLSCNKHTFIKLQKALPK